MDGILSSKDSVAVDSEQANALTDSNSKSRSSSKRRSKSRSKVWEKVAWFTRKTKGGRENKSESPKGARKEQKSPTLNGKRGEECIDTHNRLNALDGNTSPDLCKTKTKSGVRKTRSFNYLKRKKLKHYANEASSTILDENGKENADPSSGQTATGTFHDFASAKRSSRIAATSGILVSEMAKELNCKQKEQVKESMKSSLSLPLSLLSLSERPENLVCKSCQGLPKGLPLDSNSRKSFSGPNYNSWPRKKRLLVANQSYEACSPPQKQKRTFGLRKTATFSGFDSTKLCINYSNKAEKRLQGVKSTPLLSGQNQIIKNQNGLTIGVIHFFKSPRNYSNISSMITNDKRLARSLLTDELEKLESCENSTEHPNNEHIDKDSVDIPNIVKAHLDLKSKNTGSNDELLSRSNSKQEFFSKNKQCCSLHSDNIDNISEELGECSSTGTVESVKESLIVEDPVNDMCSLPFKDPSKHLENSCQTDLLDNGCQQLYVEDSCTSSEAEQKSFESSSSEARDLDLTLLISSQKICETDRRAEKLEMIEEVPYSLSEVNTENTEFSGEYSEFNKLQKGLEKDMNSLSHPKETGIYCIKIEDQVTDFSKEAKMDFQSQAKLQPSSTFLDPFIERSNTYIKETPLFQSANNLKPSDTLCVMNNSFKIEPEHRTDSAMLERSLNPLAVRSMEPSIARTTNYVSNTTSLKHTLGEYHEGEDQNNSMLKNTLHLSSQKLLKGDKPRINGPQFKDQTQTILEWFSKFNDEQKNILIKKLLEQCDLPQMHLLSVVMEPVLHKTCPSNCQDMLAWLPHPVTKCVMSYLDPESLCRCSQVNRFWNSLASNHLTWKRLCKSNEWQLSRKTEEKQLLIYTLPCGTVQWKKMFAERYLLRRNWLNGRCKVRTFEGHTQGISCVQFDDTRIVSGSTDKTIKVWDLSRDDSHAVLTLAGHSGTVRCLNLNGNRLVSGSVDRSIKVWDLSFESYWSGASCKVTMVGHMHTVRCLQVDDEKVLSGSYDKTLKVWDIKTGQCKLTLRGHNAAVLCVQFDDSKIVSGSYDNTIKVWSLQEGDCLMTLSGHHDAVTCLNLTQDGRKVISGSLDHNLKFWDLATGKCIGTLDWIRSEGHTGVIRCLQSDSWRIVSAGDDKTLKMWSLETGQRLLTLRCHTDGVTCLQFNDYRIVSGSYDKTVKVWNFSPKHEFLNPL